MVHYGYTEFLKLLGFNKTQKITIKTGNTLRVVVRWLGWLSLGPRTLHTKPQTMQLSFIHTTIFFHNNKIFFNSFVCRKRFPQQLFYKKLCSFVCSVRGPLSAVIYAIQTLGVGWYGNKNTSSKIYIRHGISMPAKHIHPLSLCEGESSKSIRKGFKKRI